MKPGMRLASGLVRPVGHDTSLLVPYISLELVMIYRQSVVYTVFTVQDTVFTVKDTVFTVQDTVFTVKDTVFTVKDTVFTVKDTVLTVQDTVLTVQDTSIRWSLIPVYIGHDNTGFAQSFDTGGSNPYIDIISFIQSNHV
jgi:hypothetical protein